MTIDLEKLAREIATLTTDRPGEYATPYYTAYSHVIRTKSPALQRRLMLLLNHGATLDAASLLFHAAFDDENLSHQVQAGRPGHISLAVVLDHTYRQMSGPHVAKDPGHALLLAVVRVHQEREAAKAVRHA